MTEMNRREFVAAAATLARVAEHFRKQKAAYAPKPEVEALLHRFAMEQSGLGGARG
jgi:hypothetical protein